MTLTFLGHDTIVTGVAFNPDSPGGQHLASIDWATSLNLWSGEESATTTTINRQLESSRSRAFSPDGRGLALASGRPRRPPPGATRCSECRSAQPLCRVTGTLGTAD